MDKHIAIIGGGPAGLMAAEVISRAGFPVTVYDSMPTVGRKLLMAGKSGLNLTHSEPMDKFVARFGTAKAPLSSALNAFDNDAVCEWAAGLGCETFVGSSGRVFPMQMKASPLLRAWLKRLRGQGVIVKTRHRWVGFDDDRLVFETPEGELRTHFDAVVLALGGASWSRLGSDAAWVGVLENETVAVAPFRPANCGFDVGWSDHFVERFAGAPVKSVAVGKERGEFVISRHGVEGSLIYAQAARLRVALEGGHAELVLDLAPDRSLDRLQRDLGRQSAKASFSNRLRKAAGLDGVKSGLVRELTSDVTRADHRALAAAIKALKIPLIGTRPIDEAISVAGGIAWSEIDGQLMLKELPGVFVAGEMVDWEAPTGGYLISACLATGYAAGQSAIKYLRQ
ncbi:TIGR03862 family flavoprotein [Pelagibacterium sp.]|uniref:TIGR03862 family flavoprotein n=1 Tax=Pelagibacterium sp. TaxID=1967288 RepID=UPI003A93F9DD